MRTFIFNGALLAKLVSSQKDWIRGSKPNQMEMFSVIAGSYLTHQTLGHCDIGPFLDICGVQPRLYTIFFLAGI